MTSSSLIPEVDFIQELPFFFGTSLSDDNGGYPISFPFRLYLDKDLAMFRQHSSEDLNQLLHRVYMDGSLAEGSISNESGRVYVEEVVRYIQKHTTLNLDSEILEVGFGSGIILKQLKDSGYHNLSGVEPGLHNRVEGLEGINLIRDFFPSGHFRKKVDLVYSLLVLEHIEDPRDFVRNIMDFVKPNGKAILSVPNCEPFIASGDISIFVHEHFSYFTSESIKRLVRSCGFVLEDISEVLGSLMFTITWNGDEWGGGTPVVSYDSFHAMSLNTLSQLKKALNSVESHQIALYAPVRALNYLFMLAVNNIRLLDDSSEMHGRYLPGQTNRVESFDDILKKPPRLIIIFSRTFGQKLKSKCIAEPALKDTEVLLISDLE